MDTALYYTFSTIAQSLAAAMALLAAFAMYRLKAISDECYQSAVAMEGDTGGGSAVRVFAIRGDWPGTRAEVERRLREQGRNSSVMQARLDRLTLLVAAHRKVLRAMWVSLALTAIVVAASITALAFVPTIYVACYAQTMLVAGIVATVACLAAYGWLLIEAFRV